MLRGLNLCFVVGILINLSFEYQAPGTIFMKISYSPELNEMEDNVFLHSKISSLGVVSYDKKEQMKSVTENSENLELSIQFNVPNISEFMDFVGTLTIYYDSGHKTSQSYKFIPERFQYKIKSPNDKKTIPKSFYSQGIKKELDVQISVKCKRNYYPENNCSAFCIKTENTEYCDSYGNKICQKGFYYNSKTQTCETDWCSITKARCENAAKCINQENDFTCSCTLFYKGRYCEIRRGLCEGYVCPNGTRCVKDVEAISCQLFSTENQIQKSSFFSFNSISTQTLIIVFGSSILMIITLGVTIWACRNPKKKFSRSMETSINSGQSYYPNNSISKFSNTCGQNNFHQHQCLCMRRPILDKYTYASLRQHSNRTIQPWNRAYSDLMIATTDRKPSLTSAVTNEETFPLPLPIDEENNTEYFLEL